MSKEMKKQAQKILTELDNILEEQGAQYQIEVKKISQKPAPDSVEEEEGKEQDLSWTEFDEAEFREEERIKDLIDAQTEKELNISINYNIELDPNDDITIIDPTDDDTGELPKEIKELGEFLEKKGVEIVQLYENTGKIKEANELKQKLYSA